ncbi:hypothetical protein S7335_3713 [Synechococcus sp. PCC 7335]|uniref:hypothetical protein n=1 Tax=Synechococcus sp. (strain ATCC 29403 / PCC 7335) TaxID=91464 RepID=UPI00017EB453|nr:hypothetical protein [Synechococcus sp. PCC 7335]EDX86010.1 hypothetical protein S7335_3713 [Synechococcus sp. PCC 7335]
MEENKAIAEQLNPADEQPKTEVTLTDEQLEEVAGGGSHKQIEEHFEEDQNAAVPGNTTIDRGPEPQVI